MIDAIHSEFAQELALEAELNTPHHTGPAPSIARPEVFKPQLARPLHLPRLVVDRAGNRPTSRKCQARSMQPIRMVLHLTSAHRCTSETCRYTVVSKCSSRNRRTCSMASRSDWHDHRYSEDSRTIAMQLSRPRETHTLIRSEVSNHVHCPRPAPCGYMCRCASWKAHGTTTGSSAAMAWFFQVFSCRTKKEARSRLSGLPSASV